MTKQELAELREAFKLDVLFGGDPDALPPPCWFAQYDDRPCDGPPRAAHWIKRRRVEKVLGDMFWGALLLANQQLRPTPFEKPLPEELIALAAWDPRNAVPSCALHDERHDSQRMPPLVVPAHLVPIEVAEFALDWGLEFELERRSPAFISGECPTEIGHRISTLEAAKSERELMNG